MKFGTFTVTFFVWCLIASSSFGADKKPVFVAIDGEFGLANSTSAQAIELGVKVALDEINRSGGVLGGRALKLIVKDNRSMPARGIHNLRQLAKIKDLVAVFSGRFSPVVLESISTLAEHKLINLAPWSSADGVTENNMTPNFVFRLSLKDRFAMPTMLRHAVANGATKIGLLLTNTSWGRSNLKAAQRYLNTVEVPSSVGTVWYNWRDKSLLDKYHILRNAGAQAILLVANDDEGASLVTDIANLPEEQRLPIISHWGVTGGNFIAQMGRQDALSRVDFGVVQTFSLFKADKAKVAEVMAVVKRISKINKIEEIDAPVGFGHAYDLMHILAKAIDMAGSTDRKVIRDKLEQVVNYSGLVKHFDRPFSPTSHDALTLSDVFVARYHADGTIHPIGQ